MQSFNTELPFIHYLLIVWGTDALTPTKGGAGLLSSETFANPFAYTGAATDAELW